MPSGIEWSGELSLQAQSCRWRLQDVFPLCRYICRDFGEADYAGRLQTLIVDDLAPFDRGQLDRLPNSDMLATCWIVSLQVAAETQSPDAEPTAYLSLEDLLDILTRPSLSLESLDIGGIYSSGECFQSRDRLGKTACRLWHDGRITVRLVGTPTPDRDINRAMMIWHALEHPYHIILKSTYHDGTVHTSDFSFCIGGLNQ